MADCAPQALCPGHGGPVAGDKNKIARMLNETAEFLETVVARTLAAMEDGSPPHVDIVTGIDLPKSDSPWLQPVYDDTEFLVRNVIRYYGGWWSGRPSELKPAPRAKLAEEIAALCGGAPDTGRACGNRWQRTANIASPVISPISRWKRSPPTMPCAGRSPRSTTIAPIPKSSLMAINIFNSAAAYARAGRPFA